MRTLFNKNKYNLLSKKSINDSHFTNSPKCTEISSSTSISLSDILCIIENDDVQRFQSLLNNNKIYLNELIRKFKKLDINLLTYSIAKKSYKIEDYLIRNLSYDEFSYPYLKYLSDGDSDPLLFAFVRENYKAIDIILNSKYIINFNNNIIKNLHQINHLNKNNLKYILNKNINTECIYNFIKYWEKSDNNKEYYLFFKIIFEHYIFNNECILKLLNTYKIKEKVSIENLNKFLKIEKSKIAIYDSDYKKAIETDDNKILNLLFENDSCEQDIMRLRIVKHRILENGLKCKHLDKYRHYNYIKNILSYNALLFEDIISIKNIKILKDCDNIDIMELIVDKSLNILLSSKKDKLSNINLILNNAIKVGNIDIIKFLFEKTKDITMEIDITIKDNNNEYPIFNSIIYIRKNQEGENIFKFLLEKISNYDIKDDNDNSLLSIALNSKTSFSAVRYILQLNNIDINEKDSNGDYPLMKAIKNGEYENVILLMQYAYNNNIDMNIIDKDGNSPLILSYIYDYNDILEYLINKLDINCKNNDGKSILCLSLEKNDHDTSIKLIKNGADVNDIDKDHNSLIDYLIKNENYKLLKMILKSNNILNKKNESLKSRNSLYKNESNLFRGLQIFEYENDSEDELSYQSELPFMFQKSFYQIFDVNRKNDNGETALIFFVKNVKNIKKKGNEIERRINLGRFINSTSYSNPQVEIIKYLIDMGYNVNAIDKNNKTPLVYAIENKCDEIIELLIENKADINYIYKDQSLLMYTFEKQNYTLVKYLVRKGADLNYKNTEGISILTKIIDFEINIKNSTRKILNSNLDNMKLVCTENIISQLVKLENKNLNLFEFIVEHNEKNNNTINNFDEKILNKIKDNNLNEFLNVIKNKYQNINKDEIKSLLSHAIKIGDLDLFKEYMNKYFILNLNAKLNGNELFALAIQYGRYEFIDCITENCIFDNLLKKDEDNVNLIDKMHCLCNYND